MPKKTTPPKYSRYRGKFARVSIDGKVIHLGEYDSPKAKTTYKRLIAEWAAGQSPEADQDEGATVAELLEAFRTILEDAGVKRVRLPPRCPNLNSHLERFHLGLKSECLDKMLFFGERSLRNTGTEF